MEALKTGAILYIGNDYIGIVHCHLNSKVAVEKLKPLLTILTSLIFFPGFCQENELSGTYWSDSTYYVKIGANDTLEFFSLYTSGFSIELFGVGRYEIIDSIIRVKTFPPESEMASGFKVIEDLHRKDNVEFHVKNKYGPVEYCSISLEDSTSSEKTKWFYTDENGVAQLDLVDVEVSTETIVRFATLGMDSFSIPLSEVNGYSVEVNLKPYRVVQNQIIEFNIFSKNGTVYLSGPNYPSKHSRMKSRDKLRIIFSRWPWNWNFSYSHEPIPQEFEKK